jgi:hypothetical protein
MRCLFPDMRRRRNGEDETREAASVQHRRGTHHRTNSISSQGGIAALKKRQNII